MQDDREWRFIWSWKKIALQLCMAAAIGKYISYIVHDFYHLNWIASSLWFLSGSWVAIAFSLYNQESLSYFDNKTGRFQPRFQKRSRVQIFFACVALAIALLLLGALDQLYF